MGDISLSDEHEVLDLQKKQLSITTLIQKTRQNLKYFTDLCKTNPSSEIETLSRYSLDRITQLQVQLKGVRNRLKILNRARYRPSRSAYRFSRPHFDWRWLDDRPRDPQQVRLKQPGSSLIDKLPAAIFTLIFPYIASQDGVFVAELRQASRTSTCNRCDCSFLETRRRIPWN